ncbi:solute carrier family 22 member 13-like, partial [Tropilaelaps mercedesae]
MAMADNRKSVGDDSPSNMHTGSNVQDDGKEQKIAIESVSSVEKGTTLDDLLQRLGMWHIPIFVFGFLRGLPVTMLMMFIVFSAPVRQEYRCADPDYYSNKSVTIDMCDGSCTSFEFDREVYGYTIMEQYELVCKRSWLASLAQSFYLWGVMSGGILHAHISDWWGRKASIMISLAWTVVASTATVFAPNVRLFILARLISGCGIAGFGEAAFTLVLETVSPQQRYMPTLTVGTGWSTGMLILPLAAWFLRDWRSLQLFVVATTLPLIGLWFILPESPRWQLSTGRFNAAEKNLKRLVKKNQDYGEADVLRLVDERRKTANIGNGKPPKRPTLATVVRREYRTTTLVFCFCMSVSNMVWYYLTVSTTTVSEDSPYLGYALAALAEYPAKLINSMLIKWVPRKKTLFTSFFFSCFVLIGVMLLPK